MTHKYLCNLIIIVMFSVALMSCGEPDEHPIITVPGDAKAGSIYF